VAQEVATCAAHVEAVVLQCGMQGGSGLSERWRHLSTRGEWRQSSSSGRGGGSSSLRGARAMLKNGHLLQRSAVFGPGA
jgi:hypothetical protein